MRTRWLGELLIHLRTLAQLGLLQKRVICHLLQLHRLPLHRLPLHRLHLHLHLHEVPSVVIRKHAIEMHVCIGLEAASVAVHHLRVVVWCVDRPLLAQIRLHCLGSLLPFRCSCRSLRYVFLSAAPELFLCLLLVEIEAVDTFSRNLFAHEGAVACAAFFLALFDDKLAQFAHNLQLLLSGVLQAIADVPHVRLHISATEMCLQLLYGVTRRGKAGSMIIRHGPLRSLRTAVLHRGGSGRSLSRPVVVMVDAVWCIPLLVDQSLGCRLMVVFVLLCSHFEIVGMSQVVAGWVIVLDGDGSSAY